MPKDEKEQDGNDGMNSYVKYSALGFQMIAIIGIFAFAGYKIDAAEHHSVQWATAALSLLGVFISLYIVIRSIKS
jgi:hypothetical protein